MAAWPTLPQVRTFLRLQPDATQDAVIDSARLAAIDYGVRKFAGLYDEDATNLPDLAYEASLLHAARLYRRRDSIDGTISWGDAGAMRVGRGDPDVDSMYAACTPVVFG